ncbi:MAG: hypothetical protein WBB29_18995 [Geitlerinemataceae cyanobacterium]
MGAKSSRLSILLFLYKKVNLTPDLEFQDKLSESGVGVKENAAGVPDVPQ